MSYGQPSIKSVTITRDGGTSVSYDGTLMINNIDMNGQALTIEGSKLHYETHHVWLETTRFFGAELILVTRPRKVRLCLMGKFVHPPPYVFNTWHFLADFCLNFLESVI